LNHISSNPLLNIKHNGFPSAASLIVVYFSLSFSPSHHLPWVILCLLNVSRISPIKGLNKLEAHTFSFGGSFNNKPPANSHVTCRFSYIKSNMSKLRREIMQTHLVNVISGRRNKRENLIYYGMYTASLILFVSECEGWRMIGKKSKKLARNYFLTLKLANEIFKDLRNLKKFKFLTVLINLNFLLF
jgi:hypothetical protein